MHFIFALIVVPHPCERHVAHQPVATDGGRRQVVATQLVVGPLRTRNFRPARTRILLPRRPVVVEPIAVERVTAGQAFSHASAQRSVSRMECYGTIAFDPESDERIEFTGITYPSCSCPFGSCECGSDRGYARTDSGDFAG